MGRAVVVVLARQLAVRAWVAAALGGSHQLREQVFPAVVRPVVARPAAEGRAVVVVLARLLAVRAWVAAASGGSHQLREQVAAQHAVQQIVPVVAEGREDHAVEVVRQMGAQAWLAAALGCPAV